ncbi:MAG: toxin glutamine deamidase domain-containing protein [Thermoanaerobaculia bacterium]|nr:toxin glutamine deamidase domain-containing protein [Thermoanaerobaculia bacterium]
MSEVVSDREPLPLFQGIFRNVEPPVLVSQEIDILNERKCDLGTNFSFGLTQDAEVSLRFRTVEAQETDGTPVFGQVYTLLDAENLQEGDNSYVIVPEGAIPADLFLPPGLYQWELVGVSQIDGHDETLRGFLSSKRRLRDSLPIGHAMVKGIDLWDGHLVVGRTDVAIPGRGPNLELKRTYSSYASTGPPGALGVGWFHSYESYVTITPCGEVIVVGAEGSGMRFVDNGAGGLRPLKGHHGTMIANEDLTFDFYTKSGTRYHYATRFETQWLLDYIEDPNGNRTKLIYNEAFVPPRLESVEDSAGRVLAFEYKSADFSYLGRVEVVTKVKGPMGLEVSYEYDVYGNLTEVRREPHPGESAPSKGETYSYPTGLDDPLDERHRLLSTIDLLDQGETLYEWDDAVVGFQADIDVSIDHVTSVTEPEGGTTYIAIDKASLTVRGATLMTTVTDRRGHDSVYELNRYGSPVSITNPLNETTSMEWSPDDIVMLSRTDANGVRTTFSYDEHANMISENVLVTDFEGVVSPVTRSFTYYSPTYFSVRGIKDRVETATDRNGDVSKFEYDSRGNLLTESLEDDPYEVSHTYFSNGDRRATTDANGNITTFAYDGYGNLVRTTDPLGNSSLTTWDVRSRPTEQVDELGRRTRFFYDALDRVTRRELPKTEAENSPPIETLSYDDRLHRMVVTDAALRVMTTTSDREGRPVRLEDPEGAIRIFEYDEEGNKTVESTWHDDDTPRIDIRYTFDEAGRQTRVEWPEGRTTELKYDAVGNLAEEKLLDREDEFFEPRITTHEYDELNRRRLTEQTVTGGPAVIKRKFDGQGNVVLEVDPLDRETEAEYDEFDRLKKLTEPTWNGANLKVAEFVYDDAGNRLEEVRDNLPLPQRRQFRHDTLNRVVESIDAMGNRTIFEYDPVGNVKKTIDPLLNTRSFEYDARNRMISETVHLTRVTTPNRLIRTDYKYDPVGNLIEERTPNGNVVTHTYDLLGRRTSIADELGRVVFVEYDARGNPIRTTDANENVTERFFDSLDRTRELRLPEERVIQREYDVAGNVTAETDPEENRRTFEYDRLDRLVRIVDPGPFFYTTSMTYDLVGNQVTHTDRRGQERIFEYDDLDRLTKINEPEVERLGLPPVVHTTTYSYDAFGNQLTETDRRGIVTERSYDGESRLIEVKRADLVLSSIEYDAAGNRRFVTDANGHVTGFEYDERNLLVAENLPLAAITRFELDDMGDRVEVTDPEGRVSTFTYDQRRRLKTLTNGAVETTEYVYDGNGNRIETLRPEGQTWFYRYDGADRLTEVENPLVDVTVYGYDKNSNRTSVLDGRGEETLYAFDELDRRVSMTFPGGADSETYEYDENGNQISMTDAKGQVISREFDELDRQIKLSLAAPVDPISNVLASIETGYDANNNPVLYRETYGDATGLRSTEKAYDDFDRLTSVQDAWGNFISYSYDANGNRRSVTDPDGQTTSYTFDDLNRTISVTAPGGATQYEWFKDSRLRKISYPNSTSSHHTYDAAGRTETIENRQGVVALVSSYEYSYDRNGNRTEQIETNGGAAETTTYEYDEADRLLSVDYPDRSVSYTYDAVGNRATETIVSSGTTDGDRSYSYDERNRLLAITDQIDPSFDTSYGYDANGNQVSKTRDGTTTTFLYDVLDRLAEIQRDSASLETYLYDYQGMRVRKSGPSGTVRYVYDDTSVLMETDASGATVAKYEYGPDRLLSLAHATEGRRYYLFDGLRSVVGLMRPDGALQARYKYDAWGNLREEVGDSANRFGFTGYERDEETGLYYAKARFYDPETGRFLSEDPFSGFPQTPPSLHRYLYGYQNPTVYWDPDGQITLLVDLADNLDADQERLSEVFHEFYRDILEKAEELEKDGKFAQARLLRETHDQIKDFVSTRLGGGRAFIRVLEDFIRLVNAGVNLALLNTEGELGDQARAEFEETATLLAQHIKWILENPEEAGANLAQATEGLLQEALKAALGDADARERLVADYGPALIEALLGLGGGRVASDAVEGVLDAARGQRRREGKDADSDPDEEQLDEVDHANVGADRSSQAAETIGSQEAGAAPNINPGYPGPGRTENCVNCAVATDSTFAGRPSTALPSDGPQPISKIEQTLGGKFQPVSGRAEIETTLAERGPGARAVVYGGRGPGEAGHVFNAVVNSRGEVKFFDGQSGKEASFRGYSSFALLITNE